MNSDFAGKSLVDLLNMLEPVPEPEAISMFPATVGWVYLGLALLVLLAALVRAMLKRYAASAYRRAALKELNTIDKADVQALAALLRRTALAAYPRSEVAALTGPDWIAFLNKTGAGARIDGADAQALARAAYQKTPVSTPGLEPFVRKWIAGHTVAGVRT